MGVVLPWDGYGWHEFNPEGGLNSPYWCSVCDCLEIDHLSKEAYERLMSKVEERMILDNEYVCPKCGHICGSLTEFHRHVNREHRELLRGRP